MSAIIVSDTFTGSAGNLEAHTPDLGGAWSVANGGAGGLKINGSGKVVQAAPDTTGAEYRYVNATVPATADVAIAWTFVAGSANQLMGALARRTGTTLYACRYNNDPVFAQWEIYAFGSGLGGGAGYVLMGTYAQALTPGQSYAVAWTLSGTSHVLAVDGTPRITATDSSIPANGQTGVFSYLSLGTGADFAIDSFTVTDPTVDGGGGGGSIRPRRRQGLAAARIARMAANFTLPPREA